MTQNAEALSSSESNRPDGCIPLTEPQVFLVGAGPGNAGLLTLRAVECLAQADLVLYDRLVHPRCLDYAPTAAARICVRELAESHVDRVPQINDLLVDAARQGKRVVRLKGGDPFLFGRGGEEAEALRGAGIAYEIVPGVTAALGAAAFAGIPLTHRQHASAVAFVTGHEDPTKPESQLDWEALARFPGTLVFYMGLSRLEQIAEALIAHGKPHDTPAAVIHWATTAEQRTVAEPLHALPTAVRRSGLHSPAIVVIGPVVGLRDQLAWFEQKPLFGKRILVTRPKHQTADLIRRLELLGAGVISLPVLEIQDPPSWESADRALGNLALYHWLVFTSVNGVHAFVRRLRHIGRDLRALGALRLAAIGPATAEAIRGYHLEPDVTPAAFRSEALAAALKQRVAGQRVLLVRADRGREVLRNELSTIAHVDQIAVYSQIDAVQADPTVLDSLRREEIDYLVLTSGNSARSLHRLLDEPTRHSFRTGKPRIVSISPVTSAVIRELGWSADAEAQEYTVQGCIQALEALAAKDKS
jgi:uroporphyrinogen III methyltransferase/synthase